MKAREPIFLFLILAGCGNDSASFSSGTQSNDNPPASVLARLGDIPAGVSARAGDPGTRYFLSQAGQLLNAPAATASSLTLESSGGINRDGTPNQASVLQASGLRGAYNGGATQFSLPLDAGTAVATGTQARVSYDFEGDGQVDRQETYQYFANNNSSGWELYRETQGVRTTTGSMRDFSNGTVKLEVWSAIGRAPVSLQLDTNSAYLDVPMSGTTATPGPSPTPTPPAPSVGGTLYPNSEGLSAQASSGQLTVASADGLNRDGNPYRPLSLRARGLTGTYNGGTTAFQLLLDAGNQVACATQVRLSLDFDGNGSVDRVETYQYFPTDAGTGWETYTQASRLRSSSGAWANFRGGSATMEVWSALGRAPTRVRLDGSSLQLPIGSEPTPPAPTPPGPTPSPSPAPPTGDWTLSWQDEFDGPDGSKPNPTKWAYQLGGNGFGNDERQTYTDRTQNVRVEQGNLVIEARKENLTGSDGIARSYTSGRLHSLGKITQQYGKIEARIKIPAGQGIWPAFWMLGADRAAVGWPACGEIDIMENIGREAGTVHGTAHGPGYSGGAGIGNAYRLPAGQRFADDFHVYAVEWKQDSIQWKVDGQLYHSLTPSRLPAGSRWAFNKPFYMLLNVAVGGYWPGYPDASTVFSQKMVVDYVRIYRAP